jgi:UDP-GlcNAc:undecaprenyl-phosphate GlcNAc-1-phosphate transferase
VLLPFFGPLPIFSGMFTIAWLLLTINALNWFDGIPGQVSMLSTIGFAMLGLLALLRNGQPEVAMIAFTLASIALASCCFDFPPGRVLMGDSGSMFFGLMLGLLGVYQGGKVATAFLAIGIPLLDALFVIIRRLRNGTSPFRGGKDHLHHMLLARGWSARSVVLLTATISTLFGGTALFLNTAQKGVAGMLLLIIVIALSAYALRTEGKRG